MALVRPAAGSLRNDLGLLSEEYDPRAQRLVGNFPQAFSHVSLVNSACRLSGHDTLAQALEAAATQPKPRLVDRHLALLPGLSRPKRRRPPGALTPAAAAPAAEATSVQQPAIERNTP